MPEVLTAETQPVPAQSLGGDGLLMGPRTPAGHSRRSEGSCRGERGSGAVSTHTRGSCHILYVWKSLYDTLICAPFREEKTQLKHLLAVTHDTTPEELLDYSKTRHARCKNIYNFLFRIKSRPPLTQFPSNCVRCQLEYFCYKGDFFHTIMKSFASIFRQNFSRSFFASYK